MAFKYVQITEDTKKKFYETFGRNERMVEDDVRIIKAWMKTQPHLPEMMDDVKINNFLNLCKFSVEKTKERIDMYYTIRSLLPDYFERSNPKLESAKKVFDETYLLVFPNLIDDVHRLHFWKQKRPNTLELIGAFGLIFSMFEVRLHEDFMTADIFVLDFLHISLGDMKKLTPTTLSNSLAIYKKVYSLRLKKIIFLNCPAYMSVFVAILKVVLSPKLFRRIELYADDEGIKKILPKEVLPKDYGGEGLSLDDLNDLMYKKLLEYQERFDKLDKLRVDESLRPEKLNNDEILGYYGSFKKIDVD